MDRQTDIFDSRVAFATENDEMQILLLYFYIFVRYCQLHCYVTVKSVYIGGMQVNSIQELKHQTPLALI